MNRYFMYIIQRDVTYQIYWFATSLYGQHINYFILLQDNPHWDHHFQLLLLLLPHYFRH